MAWAQSNLGGLYWNGQGVVQDFKEAVKCYRRAAEQGDSLVQFFLGAMYYYGQGVIQDNVYAHMWWNVAASNENALAVGNRDRITIYMTAVDLFKALGLARACVAKKSRAVQIAGRTAKILRTGSLFRIF